MVINPYFIVLFASITLRANIMTESRHEKTGFSHICENKGTDHLCSYCSADQRPCFRYINNRTYLLLIASRLLRLHRPVCVGPGRKPKDRFSRAAAHVSHNKGVAASDFSLFPLRL